MKMRKNPTLEEVRRYIVAGRNKDAAAAAKLLIAHGIEPRDIMVEAVTKAMEYLDKKCTVEEFNLLELMLAGRAAMDVIEDVLSESTGDLPARRHEVFYRSKNRIVLATIKGDIHEIGKKIFSMIAKSHGYWVMDLGKDVAPRDIVSGAAENKADVIGVSSLITSTIAHVRTVKSCAMEMGMKGVKVIAGGAALRQASCRYLNVDYVADNAFDALEYIKGM